MSARTRFLFSALLAFIGVTLAGLAQSELFQFAGVLLAGAGILGIAYEDERKQK